MANTSTTSTLSPTMLSPTMQASAPMMEWWSQQWFQGVTPVTRLQLAWMESMADVMQQEARFFSALSEAGRQLSQCYDNDRDNPQKIKACYEELAREVADQHMQRIKTMTTLPHEFKRRVWEEL